MRRSEMIRGLGRRYPGLSRQVLELSANGFLPRGLFDHWLGQDIANVVFVDGIITDYPDMLRDVLRERGMPLPTGTEAVR